MDTLSSKFKSIIAQKKLESHTYDDVDLSDLTNEPAVAKFKEHSTMNFNTMDQGLDRERIKNIEKEYFQDDFDSAHYEIEKFTEDWDVETMRIRHSQLLEQHCAVSRRLAELVLQKHPNFQEESRRVADLLRTVDESLKVCTETRRSFHLAEDGLAKNRLIVVNNFRKRQKLESLLKCLHTIKTLQRTDERLKEMIEEDDFTGAIQLCLECQKVASAYRYFICIRELNTKLKDTMTMIEENLDVALSRMCLDFNADYYTKIQTAYGLLGKTQSSLDQLHMHFTSAIHNTAFQKVLGYAQLCQGAENGVNLQKRPYADLCALLPPELSIPCLVDLCRALWVVLRCYHAMTRWHTQKQNSPAKESPGSPSHGTEEVLPPTAPQGASYIQQKLEQGRRRMWMDVSAKVRQLLLSLNLTQFKFEQVIRILDIVNRLVGIGEEFCNSKSEALQESIRKQILTHFRGYHRLRLEELKMFLENEAWELCPVKNSFTVLDLQEFKAFRGKMKSLRTSKLASQSKALSSDDNASLGSQSGPNYFDRADDAASPFDFTPDEDTVEDIMMDSDSEFIPEGEIDRRASVEENELTKTVQQPPILANVTLELLRMFGRYLQMVRLLKPIARDALVCMYQLYEYYLYSIHHFFASEKIDPGLEVLEHSQRLNLVLKRVARNFRFNSPNGELPEKPGEQRSGDAGIGVPQLCPAVQLRSRNALFGLSARLIACHSLAYVHDQFTTWVLPYLSHELASGVAGEHGSPTRAQLSQFAEQTLSNGSDVLQPALRAVSSQVVDWGKLVNNMANVNWDVRDILSQHNRYVDILLEEMRFISAQISNIRKHIPVPRTSLLLLWSLIIELGNQRLVDGFAMAKRCSNEGRALMQLDLQQYLTKLEQLTDVRPLPLREHPEAYIKAYYLPEGQLESWIREHRTEYRPRHLVALVNCMSHLSKRSRQRLLGLLEQKGEMSMNNDRD